MKSHTSSIGDYQVGRTLGEGTFGKVKLAHHRKVRQAVAVKVLYKQRITQSSDVERITREIAILKAVSHPNIVRLFQIIETQDEIYLVMEYAQRGDLIGYIRSKERLEEEEAARLFYEVISAVEYIHSIGVAHRDLKPSNILLTNELKIKLADFGLSNMYREGTKLTSPCGSPCYAAPEVIEGRAYEPLLADIWSMGVVLYMMLTGYLPYQHKNTHSLYKLILNARYEIPSGVSKLAADLIDSIFKTNPAKRIRLRQIKNHPWLKLHLGKNDIPQPLPNKLPINDKVLQVLDHEGYRIECVLGELKKNKHGGLSTLYHLYCLKSDEQLNNLVRSFQRTETGRNPQRMMSIEVRNPAEASHSARKLLRRTPRNQIVKKSTSRDQKSTVLKGTYMKIAKNNSSNTVSLNSTMSFCSSVHNRTMQSTQQSKLGWNDNKSFLQEKKSVPTTTYTSNPSTSIERRVSIQSKRSIKSRRFSFIRKETGENQLDVYSGPFSLECVFTADPADLKQRISNYAKLHRLGYREIDRWLFEIRLSEQEQYTLLLNRLANTEEAVLLRFCAQGSSVFPRKLLAHLHTTLM